MMRPVLLYPKKNEAQIVEHILVTSRKLDLENDLIKEAYAASLDPERIKEFEAFWEAYIDSQTQNSSGKIDWENTPVNAHITLAMDIIGRVRSSSEELEEAQSLVESHYGFGFIIDIHGKIIVSNTEARRFTSKAPYLENLAIDKIGAKAIQDWLQTDDCDFNFFHVHIAGGSRAIPWFISPIKLRMNSKESAQKHFLITSVESNLSTVACNIIGKSFGLSPAEAQVAGMLADGCSPSEIADLREVKITAVRTQIVNIKNKIGARDIPDIVRRFVSMGLRERSVRSQISRMEAIRGIDRHMVRDANMTLRDGRRLQYFEQGHPKGRILLNIHSLISGVKFSEQASKALVLNGYRMISPSRAGYGKSDPNPQSQSTDVIEHCVKDLIELLDHIGANEVIITTGWAGAIAQKLALRNVGRVKGLVFCGTVPTWEHHYQDSLSKSDRIIIKTSRHAPEALSYLIQVRTAVKNAHHNGIFLQNRGMSTFIEQGALRQSESYPLIETTFKHNFKQGVRAFCEDLASTHQDWTEDGRKLEVPVIILKGTERHALPNEAFEKYLNAVTQSKLVEVEGAGLDLTLTHFQKLLDVVSELYSQF